MGQSKDKIKVFIEEYKVKDVPAKHPQLFELKTIIPGIMLGLLGIIIGLELLTRVGITANTSIIGAIIAIGLSRIPLSVTSSFRNLSRQNLLQTVISGATFGGANAIFLPIGILWLISKRELVPIMLLGAFLGLIIDATILYRIFDSRIYPAGGTWPPGVATAECIIAGDKGGKRAKLLSVGGIAGIIGRFAGIPMDIFGVCWIGNIWALTMFAAGLLIRGYSITLFNVDINKFYLPHGVMIGAGVVAMFQIIAEIAKENKNFDKKEFTINGKQFGTGIGSGFIAFLVAALIISAVSGIYTQMSPGMLFFFIIYAGISALISELIVGISSMHAGWFPSFATTLIFLTGGMLIGFPQTPLALLTGFTASTGPAFADMAYDLKTGWILRGNGKYTEFEKQGRKQQYFAEILGFTIALIVVTIFYKNYFKGGLFPPVDRVYIATIQAGTSSETAKYLLMWSIPGVIIQLIGGISTQIGILFATGLLIHNPIAGWTALVALAVRAIIIKIYGKPAENPMYVLAGGFIAGSALCGFISSTLKIK
ncbi:OPT family oligopeptide transporter [candidate division KSB1 bacterium]|nr:MAG: OPT family oligopeptide transporter [candidate division KSB1 bacterium]